MAMHLIFGLEWRSFYLSWLHIDKLVVVDDLVQGLLEDVGLVVGEVVDVLSLFMNGEQMSQNKGEQLSQNGGTRCPKIGRSNCPKIGGCKCP